VWRGAKKRRNKFLKREERKTSAFRQGQEKISSEPKNSADDMSEPHIKARGARLAGGSHTKRGEGCPVTKKVPVIPTGTAKEETLKQLRAANITMMGRKGGKRDPGKRFPTLCGKRRNVYYLEGLKRGKEN